MDIDLHLLDRVVLRGLPDDAIGTEVEMEDEAYAADHIHFPCDLQGSGVCLELSELKHFVALRRRNTYWVEPHHGHHLGELWGESYFLLFEREDGLFGLLLGLPHQQSVSAFSGCPQGLIPKLRSYDIESQRHACYMISLGPDPFELIRQTMLSLSEHLDHFQLLDKKHLPDFINEFGWCTWEAFHQEVDHDKLREGLRHWRKLNFMPGMLLLDDGWSEVQSNRLMGFDADPDKFPEGLTHSLAMARYEFHTRHIGIWHTLQGYWHGLGGALLQSYKTRRVSTAYVHHHASEQGEIDLHQIAPDAAQGFFNNWYAHLKRAGVDFIKVDNQAGSAEMYRDKIADTVSEMGQLQEAVQANTSYHFQNGLISCMCHLPEIFYHAQSTAVWRNSDDFSPSYPPSHQAHVLTNAYNNLWFAQSTLPDWDMFWTKGEAAVFHAMARAISGGPIYVADNPGETDIQLVRQLTGPDRRTLRAQRPAMPARSSLFADPARESRLLKITNLSQGIGLMGIFHCQWRDDPAERLPITDRYRPSDIHDLTGDQFAVYEQRSGRLYKLDHDSSATITLAFREAELLRFSPIRVGCAALGLLNKFVGTAAIEHHTKIDNNCFLTRLKFGGKIGYYSQRRPRKVLVNHQRVDFHHESDTGLLVINNNADEAIDVLIQY